MAQYVVRREPVRYTNGKMSPVAFYKKTGLNIFTELTSNISEAKRFQTKAEALKIAKGLGNKYSVVKI